MGAPGLTPADTLTAAEKLAKVQALSGAIDRARQAVLTEKTAASAQALQLLVRQRRELQALLPRLRLVVDNA